VRVKIIYKAGKGGNKRGWRIGEEQMTMGEKGNQSEM